MAPITREQALENALASSRIEGYEVTEQIRADCRRLMDGKVDARTLAAEILATAQGCSEGKMLWQTMQWILCRMGAIRVRLY